MAGFPGFVTLMTTSSFAKSTKTTSRTTSTSMDLKSYFLDTRELIREALSMILDPESPNEEDLEDKKFLEIYQEAMDLYGLIHNRFIQSPRGLAVMKEKYLAGVFGACPRVLCSGQFVLPIGMSENLRHSRVKVYCPKCEDVYTPKKRCEDVDGAYFGTSFPSIFLQAHQDANPKEQPTGYVPKIFGFKIYQKKGSKYYESKPNRNLGTQLTEFKADS